MDTLADMRAALQSDLSVNNTSSLFDPDTLDLGLNRAYRKAGGLYLWPETEDSQKTSTKIDADYYDAPQNWRPYSIFRMEVDGYQYGETPDGSPMAYPDFLIWKKENPTSTEKKWSMQWRRYFIAPTPSTNGNFNISIWGQKVVDLLEEDDDTTIFSYVMPECNEALVLEAAAILKGKSGESQGASRTVVTGALFLSLEAHNIFNRAWQRVNAERAKLEKDQPFFEVPDFFNNPSSRKRSSPTGDF